MQLTLLNWDNKSVLALKKSEISNSLSVFYLVPKYFQCPNWVKSIADDPALKVRHCICLIYWIAYSFNINSSMRICHFQLLNISKMLAFLHFKILLKNSYSCMEFSILQKLRGLSLMILSSEVKCFKICSTNFWNRKKICSYSSLPWFTYYKFKVSRNE